MSYEVNGKQYDYNSIINQNIKSRFVSEEVYSCVTTLVEYIIEKSYEDRDAPFGSGDIENFYVPVCSECGDTDGFDDVEITYRCGDCGYISEEKFTICPNCGDDYSTEKDYEDLIEKVEDIYKCKHCGHFIDDTDSLDTEPQEIYEWWLVSGYLARKLEDKGECIISDENIWGRGGTGQAIKLDWVISEICYDMEILEGQKHEWKLN